MKVKGTKNLTRTQRLMLEDCVNAGLSKKVIAEKLGVPLSEGMLALFDGFTVNQLLTAFSKKLPEDMENTAEEALQKISKS